MKKNKKILAVSFVFCSLCWQAASGQEVDDIIRSGDFEFFDGRNTNIRNPFEMRDPFRRDIQVLQGIERAELRQDFDYTNLPSIDGVPLENIRITGILLGENRRAVARIATGSGSARGRGESLSEDSFILREGMKIGEYGAEIKAILPGGVVLVEEILNVYDQVEYIETIIPVRPDTH